MAYSTPVTHVTSYTVTAADWNELVNDIKYFKGEDVGADGGVIIENRLIARTTTVNQLEVGYDATNHLRISVANDGGVTYNATGVGAGHTFNDAVVIAGGGIDVTGNSVLAGIFTLTSTTANQLRLRYDGSNHLQISVANDGGVTYNATGAGAGHTFSDAVVMQSTLDVTGSLNGTLGTAAQPNVTSVGTLTGLRVDADPRVYAAMGGYAEGANVFNTGAGSATAGYNLHIGAAGTAPSATTLRGYLRIETAASGADVVIGTYDGSTDHVVITITNTTGAVTIAAPTSGVGLTVSGGGAAITGVSTVTSTSANQFGVRYDATNRLLINVASDGGVIYDANGAGAGHTFNEAVVIAGGGLTVTGNSTITGTLGGITALTVAGGIASGSQTLSGNRIIVPNNTAFATYSSGAALKDLLYLDASANNIVKLVIADATGGFKVLKSTGGDKLSVTDSGAFTIVDGGLTVTSGTTALGANNLTMTGTIAATGSRVTQSYHTNITSTNAVTVDSSLMSKVPESIVDYQGDALLIIRAMRVVGCRHHASLDPSNRVKLSVIAESIQEPLVLQEIENPHGGLYPGVNLMALLALQARAIQQLDQRLALLGGAA